MRRSVYNSGVFRSGVDLFALKFYMDTVVPINHFWRQKTKDTALPSGGDRILLRLLVLAQYWSMADRWTDRRTDAFAVAYTALTKLALWRAVIIDTIL